MICSGCAYYFFLNLLLLFKMGCCGAPPSGYDGSKNRLLLNMDQVVFYLFDFSLESASVMSWNFFPSHHISLFSFFDTSSWPSSQKPLWSYNLKKDNDWIVVSSIWWWFNVPSNSHFDYWLDVLVLEMRGDHGSAKWVTTNLQWNRKDWKIVILLASCCMIVVFG